MNEQKEEFDEKVEPSMLPRKASELYEKIQKIINNDQEIPTIVRYG